MSQAQFVISNEYVYSMKKLFIERLFLVQNMKYFKCKQTQTDIPTKTIKKEGSGVPVRCTYWQAQPASLFHAIIFFEYFFIKLLNSTSFFYCTIHI